MDKIENPFLATLRLPVKKSPILLIVSIVLHIICFFLPWLTGLSLYIKIILTCVPVTSLFYYFYQYRFYKAKICVSELILSSEDNWQLKMSNGAKHCVSLGNILFVHPWLTIISLIFENRQEYFIFTPETLDADQFRRLRVRLRFQIGE
jgi:membrane-bound toxin of toxin-antitoxin system